jgi:hypothetical protein
MTARTSSRVSPSGGCQRLSAWPRRPRAGRGPVLGSGAAGLTGARPQKALYLATVRPTSAPVLQAKAQ